MIPTIWNPAACTMALTSHEERLSTSLITPILLPSGECLAVVVYIR